MNDVEMKRNCVDCGQEFTIPPYQQMFYTNRGWELPKRCKACREKKKQECQKKEAEEATRQFEKELSDSPYAIREVSNIKVKSPVTTLYVIGNGFDLAHGVPFNYLIYGGRMCIDPAQLQEVDTTEIVLPFGSQDENGNRGEDAVQKYRDILKSAVVKQEDEAACKSKEDRLDSNKINQSIRPECS